MSNIADRLAGSSELALRRHGMDGQRLLNMAYAITHGYCRSTGAGLDIRVDDLAQHLCRSACSQALLYDPAKNPNSTFSSYLWDIMELRCVDFFRLKSEGFGDRRYGHDNRIDLAGDSITDHPSLEPQDAIPDDDVEPRTRWRYAAWLVRQPFADWPVVHERRVIRWQKAADQADLPLDQFVVRAVDVYAQVMEKRAA